MTGYYLAATHPGFHTLTRYIADTLISRDLRTL